MSGPAGHGEAGWLHEELNVEVATLESVLREHAVPGFDLLKVDVEGREAAVLASAGLRYWRPRVVVVEATVPLTSRPSHQGREPGLLDAGYDLALFDGLNRFYARCDEPELREGLSVPANVLDNYIPLRCALRAGSGPSSAALSEHPVRPHAPAFGHPRSRLSVSLSAFCVTLRRSREHVLSHRF